MTRFGDFEPLCRSTPSYPWCNLFYRELQRNAPNSSSPPLASTQNAGFLFRQCANILACAFSSFAVIWLITLSHHRKAAVDPCIPHHLSPHPPLQLLTTGSFLKQGSTALVVFTALHAGAVVALFWTLLGNALVATQLVEDGSPSSLIPFYLLTLVLMAVTTYISLDVALTITNTFEPGNPKDSLHSTALFILTSIWPGAAALLYFILMTWIVSSVLRERRPLVYYVLAAVLFIFSQLAYFLLSRPICDGSNRKIDGSFIATVLETAAVVVLYLAWRSITEDFWIEEQQYY
ncbi:chitin synthase III catalytic subunit [Lactifluus volemus]|nr:chitin synthase III catalytic subunit [Lactifluus volemus]